MFFSFFREFKTTTGPAFSSRLGDFSSHFWRRSQESFEAEYLAIAAYRLFASERPRISRLGMFFSHEDFSGKKGPSVDRFRQCYEPTVMLNILGTGSRSQVFFFGSNSWGGGPFFGVFSKCQAARIRSPNYASSEDTITRVA